MEHSINETIVNSVRKHPALWNTTNKNYRDNVYKQKIWLEVAHELNMNGKFVKNRWRSLRDRFIREKKKQRNNSTATKTSWSLMPYLEFLSNPVDHRRIETNRDLINTSAAPLQKIEKLSLTPSQTLSNASNTQEEFRVDNTRDMKQIEYIAEDISGCITAWSGPNNASSSCPNSGYSNIPISALSPCSNTSSTSTTSNQIRPTKSDMVDAAIIKYLEQRSNDQTPRSSDDLFYQAISRDVENLSFMGRLRLRKMVLEALSQIMEEESSKY